MSPRPAGEMSAPEPTEFFRKLREVPIITLNNGNVVPGSGIVQLNQVRFTVPRGHVECMLGIGFRPTIPGDTLGSTGVRTLLGLTVPVTHPGLIQFTPILDAQNGGQIELPNLFADADRPAIPYGWTFEDLADYIDVKFFYDTALADFDNSNHTGDLVVFASVKYIGGCCDPCFVRDLLAQAQLTVVVPVLVGTGSD